MMWLNSDEYGIRQLQRKFDKAVVKEYVRFIALKVAKRDVAGPYLLLSPSAPVDAVWHAHMLLPQKYHVMCMEIVRDIIFHDEETAGDLDRDERYASTLEAYEKHFHMTPPERLWPNENEQQCENKRMQIFVKDIDGSTITFDVFPHTTVHTLKHAIEAKTKVPACAARIIYRGRQLEDDQRLDKYEVQRGSLLHLVLALRGC